MSLRNIVVLLPLERSQYSLFLHLFRVPLSVTDSGTLIRPRPFKRVVILQNKVTEVMLREGRPLPYGKDDKYYTKMMKMWDKWLKMMKNIEHLFTLHKKWLKIHLKFFS